MAPLLRRLTGASRIRNPPALAVHMTKGYLATEHMITRLPSNREHVTGYLATEHMTTGYPATEHMMTRLPSNREHMRGYLATEQDS